MPSLSELQAAFAAAIFDRDDVRVLAWIAGTGMTPGERLDTYRNNVWHNYTEALRDVYPVVERLVGEAFFRHAARRYIALHRSRRGDLHAYGGRFPGFLRRLPEAAGLPYLPWVARLEWLMHESFHAADHPPLAAARLAELSTAAGDRLRFALHPSCRLLAAPYPVQLVWQANQPDASGEADIGSGAVQLLIHRCGGEVALEPLSAAEFGLLAGLARGLTMAETYAAAPVALGGFDLGRVLARRIGDATLVDFTCDENVRLGRQPREIRRPYSEPDSR